MKKLFTIILILSIKGVYAQNDPVLSIDGINTTFKSGLSLPYWLKAGQSVDIISNVKSVSILEFAADTSNLKFSQVISLHSLQTVPAGKVWKIEGLGLGITASAISGFSNGTIPSIFTSPKTFSNSGTYTWIVPPGVTNICIEVWGGGGHGGSAYQYGIAAGGGGGGGGGYGYQCFTVIPGTVYSITVGGEGGTSSFDTLISATGGSAGISATISLVGTGGAGGLPMQAIT